MNPFVALQDAIAAAFPGLDTESLPVMTPPNLSLGDVAIPFFLAAKTLGAPPPKLAAEAAEKVDFGGLVLEAKAAGPYLNLKVDRARFGGEIVAAVLEAGTQWGSPGTGQGKRALIEHTSINPNASPHVGRGRNALVGDSISRLLRFAGYELEVHYYVNDMGKQIGLLVLMADELASMSFEEVLDAYVAANARAESDPTFAEAGYGLLAKMEEGDPEIEQKFRAVTDLCLKGQLGVLERVGASYDVFDRESAYLKDERLEKVLAALEEKGALFTDEDQRLVVDLSKLGLEVEEGRFFVLKRANGSSMYGYRDLAYTIDKIEKGGDVNIVVLGEDHKMYFQQVAMIIGAAGYAAPEPIYYSYILLKDGKMSTRQGKVVLLSEFLDRAAGLAAERVAEQCRDLSPEEQQVIAEQVAVAAIRFAVLKVNPNKNVTFDMEASLSFTGDTGPYIQYSCARINSILRKAAEQGAGESSEGFDAASDAEWALILKISAFPDTISSALRNRTCAPVATYVLELARQFTTFYHDCPVLNAENDSQRAARLQICRATLATLRNALHILGIEAPDRM